MRSLFLFYAVKLTHFSYSQSRSHRRTPFYQRPPRICRLSKLSPKTSTLPLEGLIFFIDFILYPTVHRPVNRQQASLPAKLTSPKRISHSANFCRYIFCSSISFRSCSTCCSRILYSGAKSLIYFSSEFSSS